MSSRRGRGFKMIMEQILILGEHDKGLGIPFSPDTVSGRRLRKIIDGIGLSCRIENVFLNGRVERNLKYICGPFGVIIALGRIAEAECRRQGVAVKYLPHPAARSSKQLKKLEEGLKSLVEPGLRSSLDV